MVGSTKSNFRRGTKIFWINVTFTIDFFQKFAALSAVSSLFIALNGSFLKKFSQKFAARYARRFLLLFCPNLIGVNGFSFKDIFCSLFARRLLLLFDTYLIVLNGSFLTNFLKKFLLASLAGSFLLFCPINATITSAEQYR